MTDANDSGTRAAPSPPTERDESFLRRWSRRKHEARSVVAVPTPPVEAAKPPPEKILTDADMPPLESLDANSDFSIFMSAGVSEALRRHALRKLFALPEFNQRCPLDSEWFDGSGAEPLGDIVTHEMREEVERVAQKLKASADEMLRDAEAPTKSPRVENEPEARANTGASVAESDPEHRLRGKRDAEEENT